MALVGAGSIAASYVEGLRSTPGFEVAAVCGGRGLRTKAFAAANGLQARSLKDILGDPKYNYILNLTPADAHPAITRACLDAGKSVYSEKPLATTLDEADGLIAIASRRDLLLACAPATVMWPPLATARRLIAEGSLGRIVGSLSTLVYPGPELFHPNPAQFYGAAAGPLRDMGVYQITALLTLVGPVVRVSAMASRGKAERFVRVGPDAGKAFPVVAQTHISGLLRHDCGAVSTVIVSFDGVSASVPRLELYGDAAGLCIDDLHRPDARLSLRRGAECVDVPLDGPQWSTAHQSIGPTSAWTAFHAGCQFEVDAQRARAALAVFTAIEEAWVNGGIVDVQSPGSTLPGLRRPRIGPLAIEP